MAYKNTLITGITDLLVLTILKNKGDCYAYEISKYITNESNELLSISPNTIYTVMYKLENEHMILASTQFWQEKNVLVSIIT